MKDKLNIKGLYRENEPLSQYTTWRVGGPAQRYFRPQDLADLQIFLAQIPESEPVFWLGLGSNVLIRDGGILGTTIHTYKMASDIQKNHNSGLIRVQAGTTCAKIAKFCIKNHLGGGEFFAGIPGTFGGALAMNAGAFGGETWRFVKCVGCVTRAGQLTERKPTEYKIGYRSVRGPASEWFVYADLDFGEGLVEQTQKTVTALLKKRTETQPIGKYSCGSVFKNPPNDYAARLIETAKLKGKTIGGAQVSHKHANFILNVGGASAEEIEQLVYTVQAEVFRQHGVLLTPEFRIVGEKAG